MKLLSEKSPFRSGRSPPPHTQSRRGRSPSSWSPSYQFRRIAILCILTAAVVLSLTHFVRRAHPHPKYISTPEFPKKIWQLWKVDPMQFEDRETERARSWSAKNPEHRYELLTDGNALHYVESNFGPSGLNRPDVVDTYKTLTARILQADLLRYMVMYVEGGLYADIDVEALKPISHFIPPQYSEDQVDIVVGVETDEPEFKDHPVIGTRARSFVQWTFMCKPRHPVMMRLIDGIVVWVHELARKQNKESIADIELDFEDVLSGTGPTAFTNAILTELSEMTGESVTWDAYHNLQESKLIAGVLVLPSEAFAAGTGHSNSGFYGARTALVAHWYHASLWPSKHHRYKHPVFGEVEACNWDRECVDLWDKNTAFFDALSEEDQLRMIELKDKQSDPVPPQPVPMPNEIVVQGPSIPDAKVEKGRNVLGRLLGAGKASPET